MRNIAEIIKDDKNGKQLSQTERQIVVAYIQGKYDAVRELKIGNNSNTMEVLDQIRVEIKGMYRIILKGTPKDDWAVRWNDCIDEVLQIIDKYKADSAFIEQ